jgi:hypothetical protein
VFFIKSIEEKWIHILIWAAMLTYAAIAPKLYVQFFLKEGKPAQFDFSIPQPTDQISFAVDRLELTKEPALFNLWGWSFFRGDTNQAAYERWIVLQSKENTYFYRSESFERSELQSAFEDVNIDLTNAGYNTYISKDAIARGEYQIGILFKHKSSNLTYYVVTDKMIVRTPNQILLVASNPNP